jgi:hypothetical protein
MTEALRNHLDQHGFTMVAIEPGHLMNASRTDPGNPWVRFALLARQALHLMAALFWDLGEHTGALQAQASLHIERRARRLLELGIDRTAFH